MFSHSHEFNGVKIVHSHPFGGSPSKSNNHTENEFMLIQMLSDFVVILTFSFFVLEGTKIIINNHFFKINKINLPKPILICFNGLRSPPYTNF